ncbi:hypothetical protein MMC10_003740 [Thelotrema lepadinum]|nr:hypothetical protein [Thelotrema lepadinum]
MPTPKYSKLRGARVLLLGGTAGIGFATAEASIEGGATVIIAGSNADRLSAAVSRLETSYPEAAASKRILGHVCDLSEADKLEERLKATLDFATSGNTLKIDHVVFTAGDAPGLASISDYQASATKLPAMIIRSEGGIILGKLAPSYMNPGPRSSITFSGGSTAHKPPPGRGYLAGLAATIEGMTRGFAVDLAPIRVNCVALGAVDTELLRNLIRNQQREVDEVLNYYAKGTLLEKTGSVEDVAEAYVYFMKDSFVTGHTIVTDGGRLLK